MSLRWIGITYAMSSLIYLWIYVSMTPQYRGDFGREVALAFGQAYGGILLVITGVHILSRFDLERWKRIFTITPKAPKAKPDILDDNLDIPVREAIKISESYYLMLLNLVIVVVLIFGCGIFGIKESLIGLISFIYAFVWLIMGGAMAIENDGKPKKKPWES